MVKRQRPVWSILLMALACGVGGVCPGAALAAQEIESVTAQAAPVGDDQSATWRGLGAVRLHQQAQVPQGGSWFTLSFASAELARQGAAKYLADALAVGPVRQEIDTVLPGTVLHLTDAGWWVVAVTGARCEIVFATRREDLIAHCTPALVSGWQPVTAGAYPRWLDCFDNASLGFWTLGGGVLPKDLDADMQWFADQKFTICATGADEARLVAPGLLDTTVLDWYSAKARQLGVPWRMLLGWAAPTRPDWVRNVVPLPHIPSPDGPTVWAPAFDRQAMAGEAAMEPNHATDPFLLDARRRIAAHVAADPNFTGHHAAAEFGQAGLGTVDGVAGLPETRAAWIAYLRDDLHLDLAAVGLRHVGRADAYASWDAVPLPRSIDFAGWDPATSIDLRGTWEGHADAKKVGDAERWFAADGAPPAWVPVDCNDAMLLMYDRNQSPEASPGYWLRRPVTIPTTATPQFLHISRSQWHSPSGHMRAWLNGKPLMDLTERSPIKPDGDQCYALGDAAHSGANELVLATGGSPVPSYIFISPQGRQSFPQRSAPLNRRYFDVLNFAPHLRATALEDVLAATRQGDADRPMKVMAPGNHYDSFVELFARYGAYPHCTGQNSACWAPWTVSSNQARGGQVSSEPGGPADTADTLRMFICFYLMLGNDASDIVFHNELYRTKPDLVAWIAANHQLMACLGKAERNRPTVAVLRSNRTTRLGIDTPFNWDITRGELQACGRTGQLVDLPDVAAGFADAYPVLFDAGSEVMTSDDIAAIAGYVRRGGTFVALHNTGIHSPEKAFAWPISALTGLTVRQDQPIGGKPITFAAHQELCPDLAGRSVDGWGLVLDWTKTDVTGSSLSLDATAGQVQTIASWPAGQGIAIARRKLGKGQVVTLGSTYWRDSRDADHAFRTDPGKRPQLDRLLTALGAPRQSWTSDPAVWAEAWQSKNGLFDIYPVACMRSSPAEPVTGDIAIARPTQPGAVWEVSASGFPRREVRYAAGRMILPEVAAAPMTPRFFATPRSDLALAPRHWFAVHSRQWPALAVPKPAPVLPPIPVDQQVVPLVADWHMEHGPVATADWRTRPEVAATWPVVELGSFAAMGLNEDDHARFVHRALLPAVWKGQRIQLVFNAKSWFWGLNPRARLWVGGRPLTVPGVRQDNAQDPVIPSRPDPSFSLDVTDQVVDGTLSLALEIDGHLAANEKRQRPAGVTGVFFLRAVPLPVAEQELATWSAATDLNVLSPAALGATVTATYLETRFTLPATWPAERLFLEAPPEGLNCIVLNNQVVAVHPGMERLDISHLIRRDGPNVLRWLPAVRGSRYPRSDELVSITVQALRLGWWK